MSHSIKGINQSIAGRTEWPGYETKGSSSDELPTRFSDVPSLFTTRPILQDSLETDTLLNQQDTVDDVLPFLSGIEDEGFEYNSHGLPKLQRQAHIAFLSKTLERMPSAFTAFDSSRPWIVYWALTGLCLLGEDVNLYRERVIQTFIAAQNLSGGFGGGYGQASHIATSYAAVLSLAMVGGSAALEMIDRKALWEWLGEIKQPDGGFAVTVGGEIDARGAYCAMTVITLLNLPLELPPKAPVRKYGFTSFVDKLPDWLSRCQTYEGGMAACPGNEAHGAYAFCVLASLCMLGDPRHIIPKHLDLQSLVSWLTARQYAPEGGFSGRTNKLVDACYSHWVGGCWPLVHAALIDRKEGVSDIGGSNPTLWCQEGLVRYLLCCSQCEDGGMRDKPPKNPDGYHSCYALAGLSSVQHRGCFEAGISEHPLDSAFKWRAGHTWDNRSRNEPSLLDVQDLLEPIHPVFVIPFEAVEQARLWARAKGRF